MEPVTNQPPLVAIVGETASGKSALAMRIAEKFNGEIVCADSRTVYKGMDIGTAKPTAADRARVRHHLLDVVRPDEPFTVADFKRRALNTIEDIAARGKLPLLVGGSGLYVDAVLYDYSFRPPTDLALRAHLQALDVDALQSALFQAGIPLPANGRNPRHLIRALETRGEPAEQGGLRPNTLVVGLIVDRDQLTANITQRVDAMFQQGLVEEVQKLVEEYGADVPALQAPGYTAVASYLDGLLTLDEAKAQFVRNDLRLAKRQRTWFKRNKSIRWCKPDEAVDIVTTFLNK